MPERFWVRDGEHPDGYVLTLAYFSPRRSGPAGPLDLLAAAAASSAGSAPDSDDSPSVEDEGSLGPCPYEGDEIDPTLIPGPDVTPNTNSEVVAFLTRYLTARMEEQGDLALQPDDDASWPSVEDRVEQFLFAFFYKEQSKARCRRTSPQIDKQVELWNYTAGLGRDRMFDDIAAIVISIISIPASEASCERSFSRQKRLMVHSRGQTKKDLVIARIMFEEFGPFLDDDDTESAPPTG
jgi:hypothetical protein